MFVIGLAIDHAIFKKQFQTYFAFGASFTLVLQVVWMLTLPWIDDYAVLANFSTEVLLFAQFALFTMYFYFVLSIRIRFTYLNTALRLVKWKQFKKNFYCENFLQFTYNFVSAMH